ncbi:TIGR03621 family F420-dependent LLM class oxidoreductase [Kineosporia mesophila]|uniref:TIGR03621 family F420-dependent LLM class oxidoreductase n=1 Tax=Kineosporia mesophila TaxID=566012 RepID=A0ABP6ZP77_9ACTN|nr:TIGR03621 family F420-dependent LLM class oxidoreductase [Kineosporia mesophila]MCD5353734.1 TIGR03621 family F420-dependent LLM class oxidoreductase [Kineosporia mesophila]
MLADLRFGLNLTRLEDRLAWIGKCRRAEDLGYDVITVPDHLGMPSPFPACLLTAEVTTHVQVGTFVSNTAFYPPALFARDVVSTQAFTGGRLETGLGAGWKKRDFDEAGVLFESADRRVDRLEMTLQELDRARTTAVTAGQPDPVGPLMVGGNGDRVLRLAAGHAAIVSFAGTRFDPAGRGMIYQTAERLDERVALVDAAVSAAQRERPEYNVIVLRTQVVDDRQTALEEYAAFLGGSFTPRQVGELPAVLIGSPEKMADQVLARRERFGITYVTVQEAALEAFAKVISLLR